jgi:hypothetical protein
MKKILSAFLGILLIFINITPVLASSNSEPEKFKYGLATFENNSIVIKKNSVVRFSFLEDINARKLSVGEEIKFILNKEIQTQDEKLVLPKGTIITSYVRDVSPAEHFNKNAKVFVVFKELKLPDGKTYDLTARMNTKNGDLQTANIFNAARLTGEVGGSFALSGYLMALGVIAMAPVALIAMVFMAPVAIMSCVILGVTEKGTNFSVKAGKPVAIKIMQDLKIEISPVSEKVL